MTHTGISIAGIQVKPHSLGKSGFFQILEWKKMIDVNMKKWKAVHMKLRLVKRQWLKRKKVNCENWKKMWSFSRLWIGSVVLLCSHVESSAFRLRWRLQARVRPGVGSSERSRVVLASKVSVGLIAAFTKHPGGSPAFGDHLLVGLEEGGQKGCFSLRAPWSLKGKAKCRSNDS